MTPASRRGFTLIELLIVILIIAVLAAIAIGRFTATKQQAYRVAMESDLRNLVAAQLAYHAGQDPPLWAQSIAELDDRFKPSADVTVTLPNVTASGFGAVARHASSNTVCAVFLGDAVTPPASTEGQIACEN